TTRVGTLARAGPATGSVDAPHNAIFRSAMFHGHYTPLGAVVLREKDPAAMVRRILRRGYLNSGDRWSLYDGQWIPGSGWTGVVLFEPIERVTGRYFTVIACVPAVTLHDRSADDALADSTLAVRRRLDLVRAHPVVFATFGKRAAAVRLGDVITFGGKIDH